MKTSVVISSYNGELYILEQLKSILGQSLQPDEVLIVDDGSLDSTVEIVSNFIKDNEIEDHWKLCVNEINKGWKRNFMEAFHKVSGDIVFSCDQDDIWDKDKIKKMVKCFEDMPEIEVLTSNFAPFVKEGESIRYLKNGLTPKTVGVSLKNYVERARANNMVLHTFVPGCTMAFRPSILQKADMIWMPDWAHDSIISNVSKLRGTYYFLNEPLILYRRHEGTSTPKNVKTVEGRRGSSEQYLKRASIFVTNARVLGIEESSIPLLKKIADFHTARIKFFSSSGNYFHIFPYFGYYKSLYSFLGDLYIRIKS